MRALLNTAEAEGSQPLSDVSSAVNITGDTKRLHPPGARGLFPLAGAPSFSHLQAYALHGRPAHAC